MDDTRSRSPVTDCEQNSLRCFCMAEGGRHIAGLVGGGREAGPQADAASLARILAMRCPRKNVAPLVYIS